MRVIDDHGHLEEGKGPGVLRDVLSTFWQTIFTSLTLGHVEKVPSIRHDHQKHEWEAIGRVLLFGLKEAAYSPVCLSPVFLASCLHGEETITEADLLLSFKSYITPDEEKCWKEFCRKTLNLMTKISLTFCPVTSAIENLRRKISKVYLLSLRTRKSFKSQGTSPTAGPLC